MKWKNKEKKEAVHVFQNYLKKKLSGMYLEIWNFISGLFTFIFAYYTCLWAHAKCAPTTFNHQSPIQQRDAQIVPVRMVALFHALITIYYGFGYIFGIVSLNQLETARLVSCAYLTYDFIQSWKNYDQQQFFKKHTEKSGKNWIGSTAAHNPFGVLFHHVVTVMFMYGWFFDGDIAGVVTYFVGELPVLFVNIFWIYSYHGLTNTFASMVVHNLAVVTYAIIRIGVFAIVFLFCILINVNFWNPFAWMFIPLLILIYVLNIIWFTMLLERNKDYYPDLTTLSCLPTC